MYSDKKRRRWLWATLIALVLVLAVGFGGWAGNGANRDVAEASAEALKAAVQRSAHQCYVVEGIYPPNLAYLEEHYGLQVNHAKFYISYDAFASNLAPAIRVIPREE